MALKNKDGSTYTLQKPNPAMKQQSLWNNEKYILHNMKWEPEVKEDKTIVAPTENNTNEFISELEKTKPEEKTEEIENTPIFERKTVVHQDLKRIEEETKSEIEKVFVHCLPATIRTKIDELYGDVIQTIQYGIPTSFEAVILNRRDMEFELWTDTDKITIGSVIYPKTKDKRWWKVKKKEPKADGFILYCINSDYQPSFDS
jgi:hypothetical protein